MHAAERVLNTTSCSWFKSDASNLNGGYVIFIVYSETEKKDAQCLVLH